MSNYFVRKLTKPLKGYKKVWLGVKGGTAIVSLLIPKGAFVGAYWQWGLDSRGNPDKNSPNSLMKCRASKALVLGVYDPRTRKPLPVGVKTMPINFDNTWGRSIQYTKGKTVRPHEFVKTPDVCTGGIHFFISRQEAVNY